MANVVGSLVVKIAAHTAEFTSGLQKCDSQARSFASSVSDSFGGGSLVVGNFGVGVAEKIGGIGEEANKAVPHVNSLRDVLMKLARFEFGRGPTMLAQLGLDMGGLSAITKGVVGVAGAFAGLVLITARWGDEIKKVKKEALELGITYEEAMKKRGETPMPEFARRGAELSSSMKDTAGYGIKTALSSIMGILPALFDPQNAVGMVEQQATETHAWLLALKKQMKAGAEKAAKVASVLENIEDQAMTFGQSELYKLEYNIIKQGGTDADVIEAERLWKQLQDRIAEAANNAAGFFESFIQEGDMATDGFDASMEKLQEVADKRYEQLAEQGRKMAETPIDRFIQNLNALYAALDFGSITREQYDAARVKLRESSLADMSRELKTPSIGAASALTAGSRELANAIADAQVRGRSPELDVLRNLLRVAEQTRDIKALAEGKL